MKKRLFLLFLILFIIGCAQEQNIQVPAQDAENLLGVEENIVNDEVPVTEEDVKEMIVAEPAESSKITSCTRKFSPKFSSGPYYSGSLFDAHFHMPNLIDVREIPEGHDQGYEDDYAHTSSETDPVLRRDAELEKILCNFDKENVIGVIGFVIGDESVLGKTLIRSREVKESSEKLNLFLMPFGFSKKALENIQRTDKGLFKGYGEMAFYHPSYSNTPPDSPKVMEIYKVAGKNNLIVMIHPDGRQEDELENAIRNSPDVQFLIHGPEPEDYITILMSRYPNVYYSLDAILIRKPNFPGALMYTVNGKDEFKREVNQNFDLMLDNAVNKWKPRIEKYPDRFMWGTDRAYIWTYDEDVGVLVEEYARAFIARLDPSVQEKFAYRNAEKLISKR